MRTLTIPLCSLLAAACATPAPPAPPAPRNQGTPASSAPIKSIKPVLTAEQIDAAAPKLEEYVRRVLTGRKVELVEARPFSEGHVNETWYLALDVDGGIDYAALKIFPDEAAAQANAAMFALAHDNGWPIPTEIHRGATEPYSPRHGLLMEFMVGGSLRKHVKAIFKAAGDFAPDIDEVADLYGEVGDILGYLHAKHMRQRTATDAADKPLMEAALARCAQEGWCDEAARTRLRKDASGLDGDSVTFCHGDLYESQIIMGEDGRVRAFIDLDQAGYCDPASDLGDLLGHVVYVNPVARPQRWQTPAPTQQEVAATVRQVLLSYRAAAGIPDAQWPAFVARVRAHAWLRMAMIMVRYEGNAHATAMVDGLKAQRAALTAADPFAAVEGL